MSKNVLSHQYFIICKTLGFCLLFLLWLNSGNQIDFFLFLSLFVMFYLRLRFDNTNLTIIFDCILCLVSIWFFTSSPYAILLILFEALYRGQFYVLLLSIIYVTHFSNDILLFILSGLSGYFLGCWQRECNQDLQRKLELKRRLYEFEDLNKDLSSDLMEIEKMTTIHERTRISRDLHDHAGHEVIAAYMSFQTIRSLLETENEDVLLLYDEALKRLDNGVDKIRETAHNLSTTTTFGKETLHAICDSFPVCKIDFKTYGQTDHVPAFIWQVMIVCLKESLTNIARHANAKNVKVELDASIHIVRLCVENDGILEKSTVDGRGLSNLKHRVESVGGSLSVSVSDVFRLVCVIPIHKVN